jgi:hypothetical protein
MRRILVFAMLLLVSSYVHAGKKLDPNCLTADNVTVEHWEGEYKSWGAAASDFWRPFTQGGFKYLPISPKVDSTSESNAVHSSFQSKDGRYRALISTYNDRQGDRKAKSIRCNEFIEEDGQVIITTTSHEGPRTEQDGSTNSETVGRIHHASICRGKSKKNLACVFLSEDSCRHLEADEYGFPKDGEACLQNYSDRVEYYRQLAPRNACQRGKLVREFNGRKKGKPCVATNAHFRVPKINAPEHASYFDRTKSTGQERRTLERFYRVTKDIKKEGVGISFYGIELWKNRVNKEQACQALVEAGKACNTYFPQDSSSSSKPREAVR